MKTSSDKSKQIQSYCSYIRQNMHKLTREQHDQAQLAISALYLAADMFDQTNDHFIEFDKQADLDYLEWQQQQQVSA